jgi:sigma-B regulation protein RsbU (phosphoserine phosphatase)
MPTPATPPIGRVDLLRRDTEIAVAAFRTAFILIVLLSPQFVYARGVGGGLLIAATIAAAVYNVFLFFVHIQRFFFPRPIIVIVDTILISLWIYFAGPGGERYFLMYFAVVVVAGLWFRRGGALAAAALASLLYLWALWYSPLPTGAIRPPVGSVGLQILLLLLTAGIVSIASEFQQREREELVLWRGRFWEHEQRVRMAQYVDRLLRPARLPDTPGLDVAVQFRPAAAGVSGDYYDVIRLGERRWGFLVADVRAKEELGLLYLPVFKSSLRLAARAEVSPGSVLTQINREVAAEMQERGELDAFISMCYAIVDLDQGSLVYANAGMEPAVLIPAQNRRMMSLSSHGVVLGVVPDAVYEEETWAIHRGDALVLFSDGLTEAFDSRGRVLGREALLEQIRSQAEQTSAEMMARRVFDYVAGFSEGARRRDDSTLLVVRVTATDVGPRPEPSAV